MICKGLSRTLIPEFSSPNFEGEWVWQSVHRFPPLQTSERWARWATLCLSCMAFTTLLLIIAPQISLGKSPLLSSQSRPHLSGSTWPDTVSQNAVSSWLCHTVQWWMGTGPKPAQWESVLSAKLATSSWSCRMPGGSWRELSRHLCVTTNQRMNPHQRRAELRGVRQYLDDII